MNLVDITELSKSKEYYIAADSELAIEERVYPRPKGKPDFVDSDPVISAKRAALREIDKLKASGEYENERLRLQKVHGLEWMSTRKSFKTPARAKMFFDLWGNLRDGMESPDNEQKKRFQSFFDAAQLKTKSFPEAQALIAVLEPAKVKKGRKSVPYPKWREDIGALDAMRLLHGNGVSIPEAARQIAQEEGLAHQDGRAKRFENLYRERLRIR